MAEGAVQHGDAGGADNRYYMPLIDLLASLVVILVLIIAASVVMQRPDFATAEQTQHATERLRQIEERIRALELTYVYPRDPAAGLARRVALQLRETLVRADRRTPVELHGHEAALIVPTTALFRSDDSLRLVAQSEPLLAVLGAALVREVECASHAGDSCVDLQGGALSRVLVLVRPARASASEPSLDETRPGAIPPAEVVRIQAAQIVAGLLASIPAVARLRGPDGRNLVEAAGFAVPDLDSPVCAGGCVVLHISVKPQPLPEHVRPVQ